MSALERLWNDKMDIYRFEEIVINGITKLEEQKVKGDVKCKVSKSKLTNAGDTVPTLINSYTLFCGIGIDLQEGDKVIVTQRNGRQIILSIGEGFPYTVHQEFRAKRDDTA